MKYSFVKQNLRKRYDDSYKAFMASVLIGVAFYFLSSKHDMFGVKISAIPYALYLCLLCGISAIICLAIHLKAYSDDKRIKQEAMRQIQQENINDK